ncbi:MAG: hypothetical protein M9964_06485 [Solirubrobacterales bacterium]|nr:hypothetical protein [Solirubrobacterales bacterium]
MDRPPPRWPPSYRRGADRRIGGDGGRRPRSPRACGGRRQADRRPRDRLRAGRRARPGVSRNGSTLAAARARGFGRAHANLLSRTVALPVITAAAVRKGSKLRGGGRAVSGRQKRAVAVGVGVAFASTLASQGLIRLIERDRALWPYAGYRVGLAGVILWKTRR